MLFMLVRDPCVDLLYCLCSISDHNLILKVSDKTFTKLAGLQPADQFFNSKLMQDQIARLLAIVIADKTVWIFNPTTGSSFYAP